MQSARLIVSGNASLIKTDFFVDHSELLPLLEQESKTRGWALGELLEGHEFFAFSFSRSPASSASSTPPAAPARWPDLRSITAGSTPSAALAVASLCAVGAVAFGLARWFRRP